MKLSEVDKSLQYHLDRLEADPETGEIPSDDQRAEILYTIHELASKRRDILEYLAREALNVRAEAEALQEEEKRLASRRQACERQEERLIAILDRECGGEKTNLGVATLNYRNVPHVEVTDEPAAISWLLGKGLTNAVKYTAPTVYKTEIQRLIKLGRKVPGCKMVTDRHASLR